MATVVAATPGQSCNAKGGAPNAHYVIQMLAIRSEKQGVQKVIQVCIPADQQGHRDTVAIVVIE